MQSIRCVFITRSNTDLYELLLDAIEDYNNCILYPTQGLINGVIYQNQISKKIYGSELMIGPFDESILLPKVALIHIWKPRPTFVYLDKSSVYNNEDAEWNDCIREFEFKYKGSRYPVDYIKTVYHEQIDLFMQNYRNSLSVEALNYFNKVF